MGYYYDEIPDSEYKHVYMWPDEIYQYWQTHLGSLEYAPYKVAEHTRREVEVYISVPAGKTDELTFTIIKGGIACAEYVAYTKEDVEFIFEEIEVEELSDISDPSVALKTGEYDEDIVTEREAELDDALLDMIDVFCEEDNPRLNNEQLDEFKDIICAIFKKKYGASVYRPMLLEDENGREYMSNFPYEDLDLDEFLTFAS